ncbi:MAG: acyl-ACP--UDP-N-acetylglucosamine O-acyltransferase [Desulfobacteraceae bacterium]|jgi:UDP-N-acetylglucosamine acyltransferase
MIHPTAMISDKAKIGKDVAIGPYAIIADNVTIGDRTNIGPHAVIEPYVEIGPECQIFQFASVGAVPQSLKFKGEVSWTKIGQKCIIREFVTINRGTEEGGGLTRIGDGCLLMAYVHIAHDCSLGHNVVMANNATLAGHIEVGDYATVGGLTAVHQFVRIGDCAFVGGKTVVVKDIPPFVLASGDRAKLHGLNQVGLKRRGFNEDTLKQLKKTYRLLFRIGLTQNEAIERVIAEVELLPEVESFINFIKSSERGITR